MNKVWSSLEETVADVADGATVMVGGFGGAGQPANLVDALAARNRRHLTLISNGYAQGWPLIAGGQVRKLVCSFPTPLDRERLEVFNALHSSGRLEIELVPQGTLAERIRAGGAGIPAFYCPVGVGTDLERGRETHLIGGVRCFLESALKADFALIKGTSADRLGNLVHRFASRNFGPIMAAAARVTIAEVEQIVEPGELDPERIATPGIYVHRVVKAPKRETWVVRDPR